MNITELKHEELVSICGGHEGFFYKAGRVWMATNLMILGTLTGVLLGMEGE